MNPRRKRLMILEARLKEILDKNDFQSNLEKGRILLEMKEDNLYLEHPMFDNVGGQDVPNN